jgi:hypothetical protein
MTNQDDIPTLPPEKAFDASAGEGSLSSQNPRQLRPDFGRYRIEQKLGQGGMGAVYRAWDSQLQRPVALKVPFLDSAGAASVKARFQQEARAAAVLQHPNICPIFDVGEIDGVPYLTMPLVCGKTLSMHCQPECLLSIPEVNGIVRKLALVLQVAHDAGVVHRDLKPSNIMLDERGESVVMDFGLARRSDSLLHLTQQGELLGTPAYMSPEQFSGDIAVIGPRSDVYSLGVILYEALTGVRPFQGDLASIAAQIALDPPVSPDRLRPEIGRLLADICLKALQKSPADRWDSMRRFAESLEMESRNRTLAQQSEEHGAIDRPLDPSRTTGRGQNTGAPARQHSRQLTLRIRGTPFAYRAPPELATIRVGRQRRREGEPAEQGNEFVLRVDGDDARSVRISRRHFEIHCERDEFRIVDLSKFGTMLNGQAVPAGASAAIRDGDCLTIAGVVTLEIGIANLGDAPRVKSFGPLADTAHGAAQLRMEATVGQIVTLL